MNEETPRIEGTTEAWENRELGADEHYVRVAEVDESRIDESLGLQMISIRLQKSLIEDFKQIAKLHGLGYQPLMRQVLARFAESEKKRILNKFVAEHERLEQQIREEEAGESETPRKSA